MVFDLPSMDAVRSAMELPAELKRKVRPGVLGQLNALRRCALDRALVGVYRGIEVVLCHLEVDCMVRRTCS